MKFYLDMELCQTILLQNLPNHSTPFCLKKYHSCSNNQQLIFNNTVRSAGNTIECGFGRLKARWGFLRKTIDIQIERVPKLIYSCFVLHNFFERNNRCRTDEEEVEEHKYIYIGMKIKQHQIFLMKSTHIALQKAEIYVKS